MRLLFVIDNLSTGGAQRQMVNLALGLTRRGHEVQIFCYAPGDELAGPLRDAGILIEWRQKRGRYSLDVMAFLSGLIATRPFDLVLSFLSTPNFYALVAGRLARGLSIPIVISERFCDLPQGMGRMEQLARQCYRLADHVTVNSSHQKENFERQYPFLRDRISTIYNGYDLNVFAPPPSEPDNNPIRILCIASVSPYKNGLCLVEALGILNKRRLPLPSVTWIGQRVMRGDRLSYLRQMEARIQECGLCGYWHWLDQRTDIVQQFHQHDVLVHPSFGEGLPNVVCEALACGRPVIVSNILDHPRLVQDGESGFLFDWQNPSDLADKLHRLASLPSNKRAEMGKKGRQFAQVNLSLDRFVDEYEALFARIAREKGK